MDAKQIKRFLSILTLWIGSLATTGNLFASPVSNRSNSNSANPGPNSSSDAGQRSWQHPGQKSNGETGECGALGLSLRSAIQGTAPEKAANAAASGKESSQGPSDPDSLVEWAMRFSPGSACGGVHGDLARFLESRNLYNRRYFEFLKTYLEDAAIPATAVQPNNPDNPDNPDTSRAGNPDGTLSPSVEEALLSYLTRFDATGGPLQQPYNALLRNARAPGDLIPVLAMLFRRGRIVRMKPEKAVSILEDYFTLLRRGGVGSPRSLDFEEGFYAFMESMRLPGLPPDDLMLGIAYRAHIDEIDRNGQWRLYPLLRDVYRDADSPEQKRSFLVLLEDHINRRTPDERLAVDLFDLVEILWRGQGEKSDPAEDGPFAGEDLRHLLGVCRTRISDLFPILQGEKQRKEAARFCIRYDIPCNGLLPSTDSLARDLESGGPGVRLRAAGELVDLDDLAGAAEGSVVRVMRDLLETTGEDDEEGESGDRDLLLRYCIVILGNIRAADSGALEVLDRSLSSDHPRIAETAVDSLAKIGRPAVAGLVKIIESPEGPATIHAVQALGRMGPAARDALPALRQLRQNSDSSDLQDELREDIPFIEFTE